MGLTDLLAGAVGLAHSIRGVPMSISRGTGEDQVATAAPVKVTIGSTNVMQDISDDGGASVRTKIRDHIVAAADYVLGGNLVDPQMGDVFTDEAGNTFEIRPPGGGEPEWRYTDQETRAFLRCHVLEVNHAEPD